MRATPGRLALLLLAAAVSVVALLLSQLDARAGDCSAGRSLYVVAHEDDSILFLDPELRAEIASGRCVRTVFVTAGDGGGDRSYWSGRERGVQAAYAELSGRMNLWRESDAGIPGHPAPLRTLVGNPAVSIVFLRLPDGQSAGRGFGSTGLVSLQKLWLRAVPTMTAVDGSSEYTRSGLIAALGNVMASFEPDQVRTQDFAGSFGDGDHSDHHATAYFTRAAGAHYGAPHTLTSYLGYPSTAQHPNLSDAQAKAKERTWFTYAPYDPPVCQDVDACVTAHYWDWWSRQYVDATIEQGRRPARSGTGATGT
jgi:LmbE family N-acetylglucosaminyl deacetylase